MMHTFEWHTVEYPTHDLYFLRIQTSLCLFKANTSGEWDIPWYITRKLCITILYHATENV